MQPELKVPASAPLKVNHVQRDLGSLCQERDGLTANVKEKTLAELGKIIDARNDVMKRLMLGTTPLAKNSDGTEIDDL